MIISAIDSVKNPLSKGYKYRHIENNTSADLFYHETIGHIVDPIIPFILSLNFTYFKGKSQLFVPKTNTKNNSNDSDLYSKFINNELQKRLLKEINNGIYDTILLIDTDTYLRNIKYFNKI